MDQPRPDDIPNTTETVSDWDVVANTDEFKDLMAAKARFIVPATVFFIVYYFALPVLVGYAPAFMKRTVIGPVNIAYLFALSQFFMAWILAWLYMRAARRFDAMGKSVLDHLQRHRDRENAKGDS
jgi:uncharacterized membrane protein (DUF485 family)